MKAKNVDLMLLFLHDYYTGKSEEKDFSAIQFVQQRSNLGKMASLHEHRDRLQSNDHN